MSFLNKTIKYLYQNHPKDFSNLCLITPNKRSIVFIKYFLSKLLTTPILTPKMITLTEFIEQQTNKTVAPPTILNFELYSEYKALYKHPEPIEKFMDFSFSLLKDFNEIEQHMIKASSIFNYLENIKKIEHWEIDENKDSNIHQRYIELWKNADSLKCRFDEKLKKKKIGYSGLLSKILAEKIIAQPNSILENLNYTKLYFIGFNSISLSEKTIITELIKNNKADIFWEVDNFFIKNKFHPAGNFIRQHLENPIFKNFKWVDDDFKIQKNIYIHNCPDNLSQLRLLNQDIIKKDFLTSENNSQAIILANENLLIPCLHELPKEFESVNITMGYPFNKTVLYHFFLTYLKLFYKSEKRVQDAGNKIFIKYDELTSFLNHSITKILIGETEIEKVEEFIHENKIYHFTEEDIKNLNEIITFDTPFFLFKYKDIKEVFHQIEFYISLIRKNIIGENEKKFEKHIDIEVLFQSFKIFNQIKHFSKSYKNINKISILYKMYYKISQEYQTNFVGEPLEGLQIMGLLETRNLSFKNLVILSVNEGVLPKKRNYISFIPNDVRKEYKLPNYKDTDAIYAYHFYRLIKSAENIHLIYQSSENSKIGSSEKSRYILQLKNDLKNHENIIIKEFKYNYKQLFEEKKQSSKNSKKNIEKIREQLEKGISASAINTFFACNFNYYLRYIEKIQTIDNPLEEEISQKIKGTIIHDILSELYNKNKNQHNQINVTSYDNMIIQMEDLLYRFFKIHYGSQKPIGENYIQFEVIKKILNNYLYKEKENLQKSGNKFIEIELIEKKLYYKLKVSNIDVKLLGFIDKIELQNKNLNIIDYKTGKTNGSDLKFKNFEDLENKPKAFQLMFYGLLYYKNYKANSLEYNIQLGIQSLSSLNPEIIYLQYNNNNNITPENFQEFEAFIVENIGLLLNLEFEFKHNPKSKYCICNEII